MKNLLPKISLGLLLGLIVFAALLVAADVRAVLTTLTGFNWWVMPLALLLTLSNYALRFLKWHYYINLLGATQVTWLDSARMFVGGFPLALSPGKLAEPIKAIWLRQASGISITRGIPVVAAERLSDGLAVLLLSTVGVITYPQYGAVFALVLAAMLGIIIASQIRPLVLWGLALGEKIPLIAKFSHHLYEFYEATYQLLRYRSLLIAVGLGMVSWLGEGLGFFFVLWGLGLPFTWHLAAVAVFVLSFSTIVGAASSMPGGLGAAELSLTGMLLLTLGTTQQIATSATLLIRFFTLWFGVALGFIVLITTPQLLTFESSEVSKSATVE